MEASAMNKYPIMLTLIVWMASICLAASVVCNSGTCEYNIITQVNTAIAESGNAQICESCSPDNEQTDALKIEQLQTNCAAILGEGNIIFQSNTANAYGVAQDQMQDNIAMVVGSSNIVNQENDALATGIVDNGAYGSYENQAQENLILIIGCENTAMQSNTAKAYSDSRIYDPYPIEQTQKNVGLLLGKKNWLVQDNDAKATMLKDIQVDPAIKQMQKNVAFAVNNCEDCEVDATDPIEFCWGEAINPASSIPEIICPEGEC
ncbi:MAG: hypothetical protein ACYDHX_12170 [Methanothrix sp.]